MMLWRGAPQRRKRSDRLGNMTCSRSTNPTFPAVGTVDLEFDAWIPLCFISKLLEMRFRYHADGAVGCAQRVKKLNSKWLTEQVPGILSFSSDFYLLSLFS